MAKHDEVSIHYDFEQQLMIIYRNTSTYYSSRHDKSKQEGKKYNKSKAIYKLQLIQTMNINPCE